MPGQQFQSLHLVMLLEPQRPPASFRNFRHAGALSGGQGGAVLQRYAVRPPFHEIARIGKGDVRKFGQHAVGGDSRAFGPPGLLPFNGFTDGGVPQQPATRPARRPFAVTRPYGGPRGVQVNQILRDKRGLLRRKPAAHSPPPARPFRIRSSCSCLNGHKSACSRHCSGVMPSLTSARNSFVISIPPIFSGGIPVSLEARKT